jgi:hypothetical protein
LFVRELVILDGKPGRIKGGNGFRGEVFRHGERECDTLKDGRDVWGVVWGVFNFM